MEYTAESAYLTARRIVESGRLAVCVPCIDEDGQPAVLTSGYSFDSAGDIDFDDEQRFFAMAVICCSISHDTIRAVGATPLADL